MEEIVKEYILAKKYFIENKYKKSLACFKNVLLYDENDCRLIDIEQSYKKIIELCFWLNKKDERLKYLSLYAEYLSKCEKFSAAVRVYNEMLDINKGIDKTIILPKLWKAMIDDGELLKSNEYAKLYLEYLHEMKRIDLGSKFLDMYATIYSRDNFLFYGYSILFSCLRGDIAKLEDLLKHKPNGFIFDRKIYDAFFKISILQNAPRTIIDICLKEYLKLIKVECEYSKKLFLQKRFINLLFDSFLKFKPSGMELNCLMDYFIICNFENPVSKLKEIIDHFSKTMSLNTIQKILECYSRLVGIKNVGPRNVVLNEPMKEIKKNEERNMDFTRTVFQMEVKANFLKNIGRIDDAKKVVEQIREIDFDNTFIAECGDLRSESFQDEQCDYTTIFGQLANIGLRKRKDEVDQYYEASKRSLKKFIMEQDNSLLESNFADFIISLEMFAKKAEKNSIAGK